MDNTIIIYRSEVEKVMNKKLEHLIEFIPVIKNIIHDAAAINITSENECIYALNGEKVKSPLEKGIISDDKMSGLSQVLKEKKEQAN